MKTYITPRIKTKTVQPQKMIAGSGDSTPDGTLKVYGDRKGAGEDLSNSRRGSWGNLWSEED